MGAPIPVIIGEGRCSSNLIYAFPVKRVVEEGRRRKNQPRDPDQISYFATFGLGIAWGQYDVEAIYSQGELIWSIPTYTGYNQEKSDETATFFTFYDGDINQAVEPDYIQLVGVENASAFRGLTWIAFRDYPLEKSGNSFPVMEFVLRNKNNANETMTYGFCLADLARQLGFENSNIVIELGDWDLDVRGFAISQDSESAKQPFISACDLGDMSTFYNSANDTLYIRSRANGNVHVIGTTDENVFVDNYGHDFTGQSADRTHKLIYGNQAEYTRGVSLSFHDINRVYDKSSVRSYRPSKDGNATDNITLNTSAVTNLTVAYDLAALAVRTQWQNLTTFELVVPVNTVLPPTAGTGITDQIVVGDIIQANIDTFFNRNPLVSGSSPKFVYLSVRTIDIGADDTAVIKGTMINPAVNRWGVAGVEFTQNELPQGQGVDPYSPISSVIIDAPFNRFVTSADSNVFVMTEDEGKDFGSVFISYDGGASYIDKGIQIVLGTVDHGELDTTIPDTVDYDPGYVWTLNNVSGTLNSVTLTQFERGENAFVLQTGEWVGFQSATLVSPGTWQLTGIARGIHGSETIKTPTIPAGTKFYYCNGSRPPSQVTMDRQLVNTGDQVLCKIVNVNSSLAATTASEITSIQFYVDKPYAPNNINKTISGQQNLWSWSRRDRKFGTNRNGESPTGNAEINESYDLVFLEDGQTVPFLTVLNHPASPYNLVPPHPSNYTVTITQDGLLEDGFPGVGVFP